VKPLELVEVVEDGLVDEVDAPWTRSQPRPSRCQGSDGTYEAHARGRSPSQHVA